MTFVIVEAFLPGPPLWPTTLSVSKASVCSGVSIGWSNAVRGMGFPKKNSSRLSCSGPQDFSRGWYRFSVRKASGQMPCVFFLSS